MRSDCQLMGTDICLCMHSMEIDFNKEERTETSYDQFVKFSIREYVAGIRKKDRKKCWPFGSLGDPDNDEVFASYQFPKCRFVPNSPICSGDIDGSDYTPEHVEAKPDYTIESLDIKGKTIYDDKANNAQFPQENCIHKGAKLWRTLAADNDKLLGRNQPRKKAQKFLLLSNILRDLAGPCGGFHVRCNITNHDNVNSRFVTETDEDESDDITLDAFFKKQKGVEVKIEKKKKKRKKMVRVEKPRLDLDKRTKRGFKDSNGNDSDVDPGKQKDRPLENQYAEVCSPVSTETANENSEMQAVLLLASHFNEENPPRPVNSAKNAQMAQSVARKKTETELLETTRNIRSSPSSFTRKRNHDQRLFANANIFKNEPKMVCACVQKKMRNSSTCDGNYESIRSSLTVTKDQDFFADTHKKFSKENLVCTMNRNPADISIANSENKFIRGG